MTMEPFPDWNCLESEGQSEASNSDPQPLRLNTDGERLVHYVSKTFLTRRVDPGSSNNEIWFVEGQRSLAATILKLCENGIPKP